MGERRSEVELQDAVLWATGMGPSGQRSSDGLVSRASAPPVPGTDILVEAPPGCHLLLGHQRLVSLMTRQASLAHKLLAPRCRHTLLPEDRKH